MGRTLKVAFLATIAAAALLFATGTASADITSGPLSQ